MIMMMTQHYNIDQKDEGTQDDQGRDGGMKFILMLKEQETRLTLQEHDDDDNCRMFKYVKVSPMHIANVYKSSY
jgi:hypothetical protein